MRKFQKVKVLNLIRLLYEAHSNVVRKVINKEYEEAYLILTECQNSAIGIGTFIEKVEVEEKKIINMLEEYCESVYETSENINKNIDINKDIDILNEQVKKIEKYIENNIKIKYEIVFMPYKACMWDSMESIWQAATKDEKCECYVVPIIYFELNKERRVISTNYDKNLMPDYVPITSFDDYDFEERRPDAIYIHNPYDNYNYVTSVDPKFYSSELKKVTDMLVFVPYFVTTDGHFNDPCSKSIGVFNSDRVILGSNLIKEEYLRSYEILMKKEERLKKSVLNNMDLEKKFIALGSPKIDKVIKTQKDMQIPLEWKERIQGKKVILYNTHLSTLLLYGDRAIKKMKFVFDFFKERTDFILLWRPHPLSNATLKAMKNELVNRYEELEKWYIEESIGIYDKSSDLHSAIAVSDGYIGDYSSLVTMYGITGKPILIQSNNNIVEKDICDIQIESWEEDDNNIWFSATDTNGLFKLDKETEIISKVAGFPNENSNGIRLYSKVFKYKNKLIFTPMSANEIAIFDIDSNEITKIPVLENEKCNSKLKFSGIAKYDKWVFLIGCTYPAILKIDMITDEVEYYSEWSIDIEKYIVDASDVYFKRDFYMKEEYLYIPFCNAGAILKFNMLTGQHTIINLEENHGFSSICVDEKDNMWLSPRKNGAIIKVDIDTFKVTKYDKYPSKFISGMFPFSNIEYLNGCLWLMPQTANMLLKFDIEKEEMECIKYFENDALNTLSSHYTFSYVKDNFIKAFNCDLSKIVHFDDKNNEINDYKLEIHKNNVSIDINEGNNIFNYINLESEFFTIEDFVNYIANYKGKENENQKKAFSNIFSNPDGTSGEKIHEYILKEIL